MLLLRSTQIRLCIRPIGGATLIRLLGAAAPNWHPSKGAYIGASGAIIINNGGADVLTALLRFNQRRRHRIK